MEEQENSATARAQLRWLTTLRSNVRATRRAFWFPLVSLGTIVLLAGWLYLPAEEAPTNARPGSVVIGAAKVTLTLVQMPLAGHSIAVAMCWIIGLPIAYVVSLAFYRRHSYRTGLMVSIGVWATVGISLLAAMVAFSPIVVAALHLPVGWSAWGTAGPAGVQALKPLLAITIALPLLAYLEHSPGLGAFSAGFTGFVLLISLYDIQNLFGLPGSVLGNALSVFLAGALLVVAGLVARRRQRTQLVSHAQWGVRS